MVQDLLAVQCPIYRQKLLATGDLTLVHNMETDEDWGNGRHGLSYNRQGKIEMLTRSKVRSGQLRENDPSFIYMVNARPFLILTQLPAPQKRAEGNKVKHNTPHFTPYDFPSLSDHTSAPSPLQTRVVHPTITMRPKNSIVQVVTAGIGNLAGVPEAGDANPKVTKIFTQGATTQSGRNRNIHVHIIGNSNVTYIPQELLARDIPESSVKYTSATSAGIAEMLSRNCQNENYTHVVVHSGDIDILRNTIDNAIRDHYILIDRVYEKYPNTRILMNTISESVPIPNLRQKIQKLNEKIIESCATSPWLTIIDSKRLKLRFTETDQHFVNTRG